MTCEQIDELLGDAVDGALREADAASVRAHTDGCAACRQLLVDLIDIKHTAALLQRHEPSQELRAAIKGQLAHTDAHAPREPARSATVLPMRTKPWQSRAVLGGLAVAASLVVVLGIVMGLYFATRQPQAPDAAAQLAGATSELQLAEQHYGNAIVALEKLTADRNAKLDPQVADAIAQSLATIDRAIGDSRAALKTQPDSIVAQTSLLEALRQKVELLQETVSLMNARS